MNLLRFRSCFRTLAVILFQIFVPWVSPWSLINWDFGVVVLTDVNLNVFSVACLAGTEEIQMMFFFYLLVLVYAAPYISDNINICTEFIPTAVPWFWNIDFILTIMIMMAQSQMLFTPVSIIILHMIQTSWILIWLLFIYTVPNLQPPIYRSQPSTPHPCFVLFIPCPPFGLSRVLGVKHNEAENNCTCLCECCVY